MEAPADRSTLEKQRTLSKDSRQPKHQQPSPIARTIAATPISTAWAVRYADAGLHPIRLKSARAGQKGTGKAPVGAGWQTRPLDLEALCEELTNAPRSNLGLRMGLQPDGVTACVALDIDDMAKAERLRERLGELPATVTTATARGMHLIFRVPAASLAQLRNFTAREGIDLRAEGGQVVAAPSVHYSGHRYKTTIRPVAKLPQAWLDWLVEDSPRKREAPSAAAEDVPRHNRELDLTALLPHLAPAGEDDARHSLVRAVGGWAGKLGFKPDAVARAVAELPSDRPAERAGQARLAAERARTAPGETPGWQYLEGRFPPEALRALERANQDPVLARLAERQAQRAPAHTDTDATGLHIHAATGWPWILQRDGSYWIHSVSEPTYGAEVRASELEASVARDMAELVSEDDRKPSVLRGEWIQPLRGLRATYTARRHTYDPETRTLTLAVLRWTERPACRHPHIDRWLRALFGGGYDAAAQWLAAVVALDRPAPCLYLPGPPGLGKSLLADGLAALWERPAPVQMAEAISDFNEAMATCPLVFTDEGFPEKNDFAAFRRVVTAHSLRVNAKYRAKADVEGCARYMIAANNEDVLRYQKIGTLTKADLDAIGERLLVVPCHAEARAEVQRLDTNAAASHEIAEHVLWLAETVELQPKGERMAAKPGGSERILASVVAGRSAEVLAQIRDSLSLGGRGERDGVRTHKNHPGEVWINVSRLYEAFDGRVSLASVKECCDSFELRREQSKTSDGKNVRWRVLSRAKLSEAFGKLD